METIVPCCFAILFKPNTDFNDAQQTLVRNNSSLEEFYLKLIFKIKI